jgi:hypothetical protein
MKKLLLLFTLFYASPSFSQEKNKEKIKKVFWGYKIGIASTGASSVSNDISKQTNAFGYCAGIFADIRLLGSENFFFRPTIQLVKYGSNIEFKNPKIYPNTAVRELGVYFPMGFLYKIDEEFEIGIGGTSTLWFDSNLTSGVQTTNGVNLVLGYEIDEKTSLQLNYSFETKTEYNYKRNALGLSVLRYF